MLLVQNARTIPPGAYEAIVVFGKNELDDGGGGIYFWDMLANVADDGEDYIKPEALDGGNPGVGTAGRWHRVAKNIKVFVSAPDLISPQAGNTLTGTPKLWRGLQADYNLLTEDANTIYSIINEGT